MFADLYRREEGKIESRYVGLIVFDELKTVETYCYDSKIEKKVHLFNKGRIAGIIYCKSYFKEANNKAGIHFEVI
jgi:hypothetical protein